MLAALLLLAQPGPAEARARALLDGYDAKETCADPQNQSAMNFCAALDFARADDALNAQWKLTVVAMREYDKDVLKQYDHQPGYYDTLLKGQRLWLQYRDAQCLAESFEARGGTMQPMLESGCKARLTRERIQQLDELADGEGN